MPTIEEAKERFPIGTKYKNAGDDTDIVYTVTEQIFDVISDNVIHGEDGKGCLYYYGKWADIVQSVGESSPGNVYSIY